MRRDYALAVDATERAVARFADVRSREASAKLPSACISDGRVGQSRAFNAPGLSCRTSCRGTATVHAAIRERAGAVNFCARCAVTAEAR